MFADKLTCALPVPDDLAVGPPGLLIISPGNEKPMCYGYVECMGVLFKRDKCPTYDTHLTQAWARSGRRAY